MPISRSLRFEILRRDGFACRYCGAKSPDARLHVDHVIPVALGGTDAAENLTAACIDCNMGKGSSPPDAETLAQTDEDAARWAAAIKLAAEEMKARGNSGQWFVDLWREVIVDIEHLPVDAAQTVASFLDRGLPREVAEDMFWVAVGARHVADRYRFAYFAGCCRKRITKLHERAAEIAGEADDAQA